jgi:hypothetical protein
MAKDAPQTVTTWPLYSPRLPGMIQNGFRIAKDVLKTARR